MKIAKAFIALLFSFVLLAGQFSFATPASPAARPKACCGKACCKHGSCCATPANSHPTPQPLLPTRTSSQIDWQVACAIAQHIVATLSAGMSPVVSPRVFVPLPSAVPLYERHCSFLI